MQIHNYKGPTKSKHSWSKISCWKIVNKEKNLLPQTLTDSNKINNHLMGNVPIADIKPGLLRNFISTQV